jgi:type III restriction enzyme
MDGAEEGEEFQCAKAIDAEPAVRFWLRNVSRHSDSFRLPTSDDFFYPDFVAQLNDVRLLVVEYKGDDRSTNDDSKEKANIGEIWARLSEGKALFLLAVKTKDGKPLDAQLRGKISSE